MKCPTCRRDGWQGECPPEPPVGTTVLDRYGAPHTRLSMMVEGPAGHVSRVEGWAAGPDFLPKGKWEDMWAARGPLTVIAPAPTREDS